MSSRANREPIHAGRRRGYALLVMLVVLVTGSLASLLSKLNSVEGRLTQVSDAQQSMQLAREALIAYAALYPDYHSDESFGFLPCPDMDGDGDADAAGSCQSNAGETVIGLLPYKTLGLPILKDSQGNCLWYAVSGRFKASATNKSENLNWDTQGQIAIRDIENSRDVLKPEDGQGGAAAVIIAPGAPIGAQVRETPSASTACGISPAASAYLQFIESGSFPTSLGSTVTLREGHRDSTSYNDEILSVTPIDIFTAIKNRKSTTGNDFVARIRTLATLTANALTPNETLPDITSPSQIGVLSHGSLPTLTLTGTAAADFKHWRNQFRYVKCASNTQCINTTGDACSGMLLFGGERSSRGPRTASEATTVSTFFEGNNRVSLTDDMVTSPVFSSIFGATGLSNTGATVRDPQYAITDAMIAASSDEAICLKPKTLSISGFNNFTSTQSSTSTPSVVINTATQTLTLGYVPSLGGSRPALYGCSWYGNRIPFAAGIRAYFRFRIDDRGAGFTFALADGSNNPGTDMCGETGPSLGYSGNNDVTEPIQAPKLALEFDTRRDTTSRSDPNQNHSAWVFWAGASRDDDIDNKHGACATDVTPNAPCNPSASTLSLINSSNTGPSGTPQNVLVRIDIVPSSPATSPATYTLKAYITTTDTCSLSNLNADVSSSCAATLTGTLQTSMSTAYLGFTVGQSTGTAGPQSITIDQFSAKGR